MLSREQWRRDRPHLPEPQVWARDATAGEGAPAAWAAHKRATQLGWTARITYARGYVADDSGFPQYHHVNVPLFDEGGGALLTPTGQQKMKEVKTDTMVVVESVVVWGRKAARWFWSSWSRIASVPDQKWKFDYALAQQRMMDSKAFNQYLREE